MAFRPVIGKVIAIAIVLLLVVTVVRYAQLADATDINLRDFRARGGKVIMARAAEFFALQAATSG
jgi:hypothetical protein